MVLLPVHSPAWRLGFSQKIVNSCPPYRWIYWILWNLLPQQQLLLFDFLCGNEDLLVSMRQHQEQQPVSMSDFSLKIESGGHCDDCDHSYQSYLTYLTIFSLLLRNRWKHTPLVKRALDHLDLCELDLSLFDHLTLGESYWN